MGTNVEQQSFTVIENGTIVTPGDSLLVDFTAD